MVDSMLYKFFCAYITTVIVCCLLKISIHFSGGDRAVHEQSLDTIENEPYIKPTYQDDFIDTLIRNKVFFSKAS